MSGLSVQGEQARESNGGERATLRRGVVVHSEIAGLELSSRLSLSTGIEPAVASRLGASLPYRRDALRPKQPWRPLDSGELALMTPARGLSPAAGVALIRVPAPVLAPLVALGLPRVRSKRGVDQLVAHPGYQAAQDRVEDHLRCYCETDVGLAWHELHCSPHDLETLTVDGDPPILVGLHIDAWDGLSAERAATGRNRICINVGREPRYFLFINLTVSQIVRLCGEPEPPEADRAPLGAPQVVDRLVTRFLQTHAHYPVVRLRIEPGEGYIAPTENIVHDGSTAGTSAIDLVLVLRGRFALTALRPPPLEDSGYSASIKSPPAIPGTRRSTGVEREP